MGDEGFERRFLLGAAGLAGVAAMARLASAGPLTPPSGAVASTGKTLTSVEPRIEINPTNTGGDSSSTFIINQPGSYYLPSYYIPAENKDGITIVSSDVTIDLMGFSLIWAPVTGSGKAGVRASAGTSGLVVRNGVLRNWPDAGISASASTGMLVENVYVSAGGNGIVLGRGSTARGCLAESCSAAAITVYSGGLIENCVARLAGAAGLVAFEGNAVIRNSAATGGGGTGISGGSGSLVEACLASANIVNGISVASNCTVRACMANSNGNGSFTGAGIRAAGSRNIIEGNMMVLNDRGVVAAGSANMMLRNLASGNNRNWDIVANNYGQFVAAAGGAAVSGSTGGAALGSTDPWVNYTF
jgi:hypothetical protein